MALDESGVSQGHLTVPNTEEGLMRLHEFSARFELRRWAVEGAGNHFISMFVGQLLSRGDRVCSISPSLTSQYRARDDSGLEQNVGHSGQYFAVRGITYPRRFE